MDAFAKLGIDWKILIAQIINFGILLFILQKFLYKPFLTALHNRKMRIKISLEQAAEIERKAVSAEENYQKRLSEANKEAELILMEIKEKAEKNRKIILAQAEKEADEIKKSALHDIDEEKQNLYANVRNNAGKLALFILTKILKEEVDEKNYQKSIEKALQEISA